MLRWLVLAIVIVLVGACSTIPPNLPNPVPFVDSPDYGITLDTTLSRMVDDNKVVQHYYLVRFPDTSDHERFEVIDSFFSHSTFYPCGKNALAYFQINQDNYYLIAHRFVPVISRDTILMLEGDRNGYPNLNVASFVFRQSDSLFCYSLKIPGEPIARDISTVVYIQSSGDLDTVAQIDGGLGSNLSGDGTELLITALEPVGDSSVVSIVIYDLEGDSIWKPVNHYPYHVRAPYRESRDSPLYYIRSDSPNGNNVWRMMDGIGQKQVSDFSYPVLVMDYALIRDSLICFVVDHGEKRSDARRVAIELK